MARAKTSEFWLTETVTIPAAAADGTRVQGTIDLGAYVDVGDSQAISISFVDFIHQGASTHTANVEAFLAANGTLSSQLTDLNPNTLFVQADTNSLIASSGLNIDIANNQASHAVDLYPDSYTGADGRFVVNDSLFFVVGVDGSAIAGAAIDITCRIRVKIVKLSASNWMAVAIQSTASDN